MSSEECCSPSLNEDLGKPQEEFAERAWRVVQIPHLLEECHSCQPMTDMTNWYSTITVHPVAATHFAVMISVVRQFHDS